MHIMNLSSQSICTKVFKMATSKMNQLKSLLKAEDEGGRKNKQWQKLISKITYAYEQKENNEG